ncbi:uncharacterized protein LOC142323005 [Lycorma delicatula]|uniref:uncharacterized protein LOC142323005 n=1 Tax=Lycorma delicatula TaxID=130591 RepID=UPI003F51AB65
MEKQESLINTVSIFPGGDSLNQSAIPLLRDKLIITKLVINQSNIINNTNTTEDIVFDTTLGICENIPSNLVIEILYSDTQYSGKYIVQGIVARFLGEKWIYDTSDLSMSSSRKNFILKSSVKFYKMGSKSTLSKFWQKQYSPIGSFTSWLKIFDVFSTDNLESGDEIIYNSSMQILLLIIILTFMIILKRYL